MSGHDDPVRLAVGGSPELRELLRSARVDDPSPEALARLEARLSPTLTSTAAAAPAGGKLWLWVAAAAAGGVAGVVWWARTPGPQSPTPLVPRSAPVAVTEPAPVPAVTPEPDPAPAIAAPIGSIAAPVAPRPRRPPAVPATVPPPNEPPPTEPPPPLEPPLLEPAETVPPPAPQPRPREVDLLGPAHEALRSGDTQRALDLATRHADLYPSGAMTEEREAIIVEGWLQLGRRDAAQASFDRFVQRFPRSGYRTRLQRLLADGP